MLFRSEVVLCAAGWIALHRLGVTLRVPALSWRILAAGAGMGLVLLPLRGFDGLSALVPIAIGAVVYAALLVAVRAANAEERALLRRALRRGA